MTEHRTIAAVLWNKKWAIAHLVPTYLYGEPGAKIQHATGDALCWSSTETTDLICSQSEAEQVIPLGGDADAMARAAFALLSQALKLKADESLGRSGAAIIGEAFIIDVTKAIKEL